MPVNTRSMARQLAKEYPIVGRKEYRGFSIAKDQYKPWVDNILSYITNGGSSGQDLALYTVMDKFWHNYKPSDTTDYKSMDNHYRYLLLKKIMDNTQEWNELNQELFRQVEDFATELTMIEALEHIQCGKAQWRSSTGKEVNLSPLIRFAPMLFTVSQLITNIFGYYIKLFYKAQHMKSSWMEMYALEGYCRSAIIGRRFLLNIYLPNYGDQKFTATILKKLLEFIQVDGAEFAFYTLAALLPQLVSMDVYPIVNRAGYYYNYSRWAIRYNNPIFGEIKATKAKYYFGWISD